MQKNIDVDRRRHELPCISIFGDQYRVGALPIAIVSDNGAGFDPTQAGSDAAECTRRPSG
jgi:hypothetical protein